jgi:hypothetical protein
MEANPLRRVLTAKATAFVGLAMLVAVVVGIISVASVSKNSEAAPQGPGFGAKVISQSGTLPHSGTYTSKGGKLIISAAGSGYSDAGNENIGMEVFVKGTKRGTAALIYANQKGIHLAFVPTFIVLNNVPKGQVKIELKAYQQTKTNEGDYFRVSVVEVPR